MKEPGVVVVVDGPTGVGRSTTLAGLQAAWPEVRPGPLLASGLDAMLASFGPGEPRWHRLLLPDVVAEPGRDGDGAEPLVHWGPLGREMVVAMHRAAAAWAHAGVDVAIDHLLLDHATATDLIEVLDGLRVVHVGLTCDPDVLEDRERERYGTTGAAVAQQRTTRDVAIRDLTLDTSQTSTDELVETILIDVRRRLRSRRR